MSYITVLITFITLVRWSYVKYRLRSDLNFGLGSSAFLTSSVSFAKIFRTFGVFLTLLTWNRWNVAKISLSRQARLVYGKKYWDFHWKTHLCDVQEWYEIYFNETCLALNCVTPMAIMNDQSILPTPQSPINDPGLDFVRFGKQKSPGSVWFRQKCPILSYLTS